MEVDERSGQSLASAMYVLQLTSKTEPNLAATTPVTFENIRQQLEQELNNEYLSVWISQLKAEADIVDNRLFYYSNLIFYHRMRTTFHPLFTIKYDKEREYTVMKNRENETPFLCNRHLI